MIRCEDSYIDPHTGLNNVDAILEDTRSDCDCLIPTDAWWYAFGDDPENHLP